MEKLVLRGIMYGADKVPDTWFDKIPGGYYKAKTPAQVSQTQSSMSTRQPQARSNERRRYSDDYDEPRGQKYGNSYSNRNTSDHRRNDSHRSKGYDRRYDDDSRDDEYYNSSRGPSQRKPRDDDRYGYDESGQRSHQQNNTYADKDRVESPRRSAPVNRGEYNHGGTDSDRPISPLTAEAAVAAGIRAAEAVHEAERASTQQQQPDASQARGQYGGYVPYSNIYGGDENSSQRGQQFHPPPRSSISSVQPDHTNQLTTSRQNPMSPDPSISGAVGAPRHTSPQHQYYPPNPDRYPDTNHDDRYRQDRYYPRDEYEDEYEDDRYARPSRSSRPSRPPMRRRSYDDSYDSRDAPRRSPSPRRRSSRPDNMQSKVTDKIQRARGKSMSRIKETFDDSKRGLGYGAVGALAGSLVGSEVGKGTVPAAIGAVLGGIGANMFEARERSVKQRQAVYAKKMPSDLRRKHKRQDGKKIVRGQDSGRDDGSPGPSRRDQRDRPRRAHSPV